MQPLESLHLQADDQALQCHQLPISSDNWASSVHQLDGMCFISELRTFRHYDVSPPGRFALSLDVSPSGRFILKTFRHLDASPSRRFILETFHTQDVSPSGHFAPSTFSLWTFRSFAGRFAPYKNCERFADGPSVSPLFLTSHGHNHINKKLDLC